MGRKIIKKELDKSKIKLKQEEASRSLNQSQSINENLKEENIVLLEKIVNKRNDIIFINTETEEVNNLNSKAKKAYKVSKSKLDALYCCVSESEDKISSANKDIKDLEKSFEDKEVELILGYNNKKDQLDVNIKDSQSIIDKTTEANKALVKENEALLVHNNETSVNIKQNTKTIKDQDSTLIGISLNIDMLELELDAKFSAKTILEEEIVTLKAQKSFTLSELHKVISDTKEVNKELDEASEELISTRETNLTLVKKEAILEQRTSHIKSVYEKAGLPLNI